MKWSPYVLGLIVGLFTSVAGADQIHPSPEIAACVLDTGSFAFECRGPDDAVVLSEFLVPPGTTPAERLAQALRTLREAGLVVADDIPTTDGASRVVLVPEPIN